jgi:hypothetical protein
LSLRRRQWDRSKRSMGPFEAFEKTFPRIGWERSNVMGCGMVAQGVTRMSAKLSGDEQIAAYIIAPSHHSTHHHIVLAPLEPLLLFVCQVCFFARCLRRVARFTFLPGVWPGLLFCQVFAKKGSSILLCADWLR